MHFSFLSQFAIQSRKIMNRTFNLEAASLRVLSGFYRNDMALFSPHVYYWFLFDVPVMTLANRHRFPIRSILLFTEPYVRYAIRQAANPILSQCGPVCSIQLNYTLDLYRKELPESQKQCQLLICWLNIAKENDDPVWRITLFRISDAGAGITKETPAPVMLSSARRHDLVREPRPSYFLPQTWTGPDQGRKSHHSFSGKRHHHMGRKQSSAQYHSHTCGNHSGKHHTF